MDGLTFTAELVKGLAWPITVLVVVVLFRPQLCQLIVRLRKAKYGEAELDFRQEVLETREHYFPTPQTIAQLRLLREVPVELVPRVENRFLESISISPRAAIAEAWRQVESAALVALASRMTRADPKAPVDPGLLATMLKHFELLNEERASLFNNLRFWRNRVMHEPDLEVDAKAATAYCELATLVLQALAEH